MTPQHNVSIVILRSIVHLELKPLLLLLLLLNTSMISSTCLTLTPAFDWLEFFVLWSENCRDWNSCICFYWPLSYGTSFLPWLVHHFELHSFRCLRRLIFSGVSDWYSSVSGAISIYRYNTTLTIIVIFIPTIYIAFIVIN